MSDKTVVYMTDPEARYVSLVKRGANRTPFRIVKQQKEQGMKIIQRIVAKKGTDVAAIKSAVGEEAAAVLNLSEPKDAGAFVLYDQHPEDAFKADTVEVVSLSEDNSVICLCGEMAEKSEGFVSKLLARKTATKGVEVPDTVQPMDAEVLKSSLSSELYGELDAMGNGIANILSQKSGEPGKKLEMVRTLCDNFVASMKSAVDIMKSDEFVAPEKEEHEQAEKKEVPTEIAEDDKQPEDSDKTETTEEAKSEDRADQPKPIEKSEKPDEGVAKPDYTAKLEEISKSQAAVIESLSKQVAELVERVAKMEKAPATVVSSHEDSGKADGVKKSENVFAGLFGDLHR